MPTPTPNFVQIGVVLPNLLTAIDTLGDLWLIQIHPHALMNPFNMTTTSWHPTLFAIKPDLTVLST